MSYHRFTNLRELLQGDLSGKVTNGIDSKDFQTECCNCTGEERDENGCAYDGICREKVIVYEVTCKDTEKVYIGCTQNNFKKRMNGHHSEVQALHDPKRRILSDTYAYHFATQLQLWPEISPKIQRRHYTSKILWQGNPLSTVKTFKTNHCMLCNRERLEIFKRYNKEPKSLINSHNEIFGGCHHNPHFHRYCRKTTSTVDSTKDEKVNSTTITTEV